jgi:hypothetical protein
MTKWYAILVSIATLLIPAAVSAQTARMPNYDPNSEVKISGTVQNVQQVTGRHGWAGTHLMVKTESETFDVHLGPADYLARKNFSFAKGDPVEVTGSRMKWNGADVLIAREISKNGKTLVLRNAQGIPQWSGGRRRSQ